MEMHQIKYFLAVAEELNFTRAAQRCNVAQPSLTRAIRMLELEFGGALFNRERQNTHMSELGRVMRPYLEQVWQLTQTAKSTADDVLGLRHATLRLGVMCTITPEIMVSMLKAMREHHPSVRIEIFDDETTTLLDRLKRGEVDVVLTSMDGRSDDGFHMQSIFRERMTIVVGKEHELASRERVTYADLNGQPYLERINCEMAQKITSIFDAKGYDDLTVCRSERDDWILEMAASGFGYACMPASSVRRADVVALPLGDPEVTRKVHLVTVRGRPHSPAIGALIREVMATSWLGKTALARRRAAELPEYDID
jgi:LysR family transcriptional regulator, hydrogen peroxide-inducible genes activator